MDLEDARKKLYFQDLLVRSRCVNRLTQAILKKSSKQINSHSAQISELNLLWEACGYDCFGASTLAIDSIVSLVLNDHVELDYAINKLLNIATTNRNFSSSISGLTKLLILQSTKDGSFEGSPYSLQYPKHPFIVVLESVPDSWPVVLENIMATIGGKSAHGFRVMEPVVNYIVFNTCNTQEKIILRNIFISKLAVFCEKQPAPALKYFCGILPWLEVTDVDGIRSVLNTVSEIGHLLQYCQSLGDIMDVLRLTLFCSLAVMGSCVAHNIDPSSALQTAESIAMRLTEDEEPSAIIYACYVLLSVLFKEANGITLSKLLKMCVVLLNKHRPPPTIAAMLIVPVVQLMSEPSILPEPENENEGKLLPSLLQNLEAIVMDSNLNKVNFGSPKCQLCFFESFSSHSSQALLTSNFALRLEVLNDKDRLSFISYLNEHIKNSGQVTNFQFHLVSGLFLMTNGNGDLIHNCLDLLEVMCEKDNMLSPSMFSLLLYKQTFRTDPELLQLIVEYLPKMATHKYAVGPVLNILQMMASHQEMKALVIYLMLQLWKKQERCFPYLQKLLVEKDSNVALDIGVCEVKIAQAAGIRELCAEAPEKYGGEFLQALSVIINESNSDAGTPAVLLALDSIYHLCRSESLDLKSCWKILASKLSKDRRSAITIRVCKLLSLVPEPQVKSCLYEKFMSDTALYLWRMISMNSTAPVIVGAAYKALSGFPLECHKLVNLPAAAKVNLKLPASMVSTPFEMGKSPEDVLTYIPGYCFVDLLRSMDVVSLKGYDQFLQSVIQQEVKELPRGVYVQRKSIGKKQNPNDILSNVPGILCSQYKIPKSVIVQKNLAVGILLSYEPPVEFDKDGKQLKRSVAVHVQLFEQILGILLSEVNLDCNDWQRCVLLPEAWGSFMERAFFLCEEGRNAELELQQSHGRLKASSDEATLLFNTSWLWVRDRLLNLIKHGYQTSSVTSANSVFAIAGLIRAVEKFHVGLEDKTKKFCNTYKQHLPHEEFQLMCTESIVSLIDEQYIPSSKILGWVLSPLSKQSTSTSALIRGSAAASLCNIQLIIKRFIPDKIPHLCKILLDDLTQDSSTTLSLFSGIGLGFFLQSLLQAGCGDNSLEQANWLLKIAKDLEVTLEEEQAKHGNYIALTVVVFAMSQSGNPAFVQWINKSCYAFHNRLMKATHVSMAYEVLSICTACMMISAASANIIPLSEIVELASWFNNRVQDVPQCSGTAISLGIILDSLLNLGHSKAAESISDLTKTWLRILASQKEPTLHRVAALNGMCALFSSGRGLIKISANLVAGNKLSSLRDFVELLVQFLNASRDSSLQIVSCWELGRLYSVNVAQPNDVNTAPTTYFYLSERSVLKPLVQFISENAKCNELDSRFQTALNVLSPNLGRPLPPFNWTAFLTPIVQGSNDSSITETALKITIHQMSSSATALGFVSAYATPPILYTLPYNCRLLLLKNLHLLASAAPVTTLRAFLNAVLPTGEQDETFEQRLTDTVQAMVECQKPLSSNAAVMDVFQNAFTQLVLSLCKKSRLFKIHLKSICSFTGNMNHESQKCMMHDVEHSGGLCFAVFIQCHMVEKGIKPLSSLRPYIETAKNASSEDKRVVTDAIFDCFCGGCFVPESEINKAEKCIGFLMETIGWIKVLSDSDTKCQLLNVNEVISFLFDICLAVLVGTSGSQVCCAIWSQECISHQSLMQTLPSALFALVENPTWEENMEKIMEWLLYMKWNPCLKNDDEYYINAALCSLRSSKHFQKASMWTQIVICPTMNI